jgi:hypothetical protein
MLWSEVLAFIDDIILPSKTVEQGIDLLQRVLERIRHAGLKLKASKCQLFQTKAKILGVIVCDGRVYEDPSRLEAIKSLPFPQTVRELRSFLGAVNFVGTSMQIWQMSCSLSLLA